MASGGAPLWSASGRREAVADDARTWEVRLCHSSCEADEQSRATGCEPVERRAEAEENAGQQRTRRAQDRESVSQALDRIRQVARQRKKQRFTSLFDHIRAELLRVSFLALKRDTAPGVTG